MTSDNPESTTDVLRLIAREGIRLVAIGGLAGLAIALRVSHFLPSLLFGMGAHDPVIVPAAAALLALAATLIPAQKAMRIDPAVTLRPE